MRVSVSHSKGREEAVRIVDETALKLLRPDLPGPVRITNVQKAWSGTVMNFSASVALGPIRSPVRGLVTVLERDIVIEVDLPLLLTRLMPEKAIQSAVETRVRGLLKG